MGTAPSARTRGSSTGHANPLPITLRRVRVERCPVSEQGDAAMVSVRHGVENKASAPAAAELLARVKELYPLLANNAAQGERDRRVVEDCIEALTEAGLF